MSGTDGSWECPKCEMVFPVEDIHSPAGIVLNGGPVQHKCEFTHLNMKDLKARVELLEKAIISTWATLWQNSGGGYDASEILMKAYELDGSCLHFWMKKRGDPVYTCEKCGKIMKK